MGIKKYTTSGWVDAPFKKWSGSAWVEPEVKKWDGTKWAIMNQQQYITTWEANWSQTYQQDGSKRTNSGSTMYQGKYNYLESPVWGLMKSLCGFDDASMRTALAGSKITNVSLYLRAEHWYYHSGGIAVIGLHNHDAKPATFSHSKYSAVQEKYTARDQARWIDMPNYFGEGIRDNDYKGFSLFANTTQDNYYGYFNSVDGGSYKPKIKIAYTK